jgi:trehalose-6-phosphate synthase
MERYQKALQDLLVQSQQPEITDDQIRQFIRGKSDREIARVMMKIGIDVNRFARAINMPVSEVRERFEKVLPDARADNERLRLSQELQQGRLLAANQAREGQQQDSNNIQRRKPNGIRDVGVS